MGRRQYSSRSSAIEIDHRVSTIDSKNAGIVDELTALRNQASRDGLRQLDRAVEMNPTLSRAMKDRERGIPRATVAPLGHPKKDRGLLPADAVRTPMSKRQRLARLHREKDIVRKLSTAQHSSLKGLVQDEGTWRKLNSGLCETLGDVQNMSDAGKELVQNIDSAIQTYERANDRGHRVYINVDMHRGINSSNQEAFLDHYLPEGTVVHFDQFTAGSHNLSEISRDVGARKMAVEIHTRRGMFIGEPGDAKSNGHLLPRGMKLQVAGYNEVTYEDAKGEQGRRMCIQLVDITDPTTTA